jgi:hypothetical protein
MTRFCRGRSHWPFSALLDERTIAAVQSWARGEPLILEIRAFASPVRGANKNGGPIRSDRDLDPAGALDLPASAIPLDVKNAREALLSRRGAIILASIIPWAIVLTCQPTGRAMEYTMHVLARTKRGASLEDLGTLSVSPKPKRSEMVHFMYRGRQASGIVTLIDPHNWERRPDLMPTIHVQMQPPE